MAIHAVRSCTCTHNLTYDVHFNTQKITRRNGHKDLVLTIYVDDVIDSLFKWFMFFPPFLQILSFSTFWYLLTTQNRRCLVSKWQFYGNLQSSMTWPIHSATTITHLINIYSTINLYQYSTYFDSYQLTKSLHLILPTTNI